MGELKQLYENIRRLGEVLADFEDNPVDEAVLTVAKLMGVSQEDLIKYGGCHLNSLQQEEGNTETAVLKIAKMFGLTPEDIKKYGG